MKEKMVEEIIKAEERKKKIKRVSLYITICLIAFFIVSPVLWLLLTSLKPAVETYDPSRILPSHLYLKNYVYIFSDKFTWNYGWAPRYFLNSIFVSIATVFLVTIIGAHIAYALAKLKVPFSKYIYLGFLFLFAVPDMTLAMSVYSFFADIGLLNTLHGLIIVLTVRVLPFAIWLMTTFFAQFPIELEDSGRIDGCSRLGVFYRVVLPLSKPALVVTAIYVFIFAWVNLLFSLTLITSTRNYVLPLATVMFVEEMKIVWGPLCAWGILAVIPCVFFALFLQKYIAAAIIVRPKG